MSDQDQTDFDIDETALLKIVAKLLAAQRVLERHADVIPKITSIRGAFNFLSARARSLPHVKQHPITGVFEFKSEGEEQYEKTVQNAGIYDYYNAWVPLPQDSFRDILIPQLMHAYSGYPEVIEALETIKDSLVHERALKEFYRKNFEPYQIFLMKEEFRENCFRKQNPGNEAGPTDPRI